MQNNFEMDMELNEQMNTPTEVNDNPEAPENIEIPENNEAPENHEAPEPTTELGYSSEYYKSEMARAIKNGNEIAYKNAEKNYAKALVREAVGAAEGRENQEPVKEQEQGLGYSSDYYKHEMARAIENGNQIAYENAKRNYANALVREQTR